MTVPARKSISRVNAALRWRVGRSGERGTLAFAHAFGFRSNKGGEEPPTTSHTTLPHIHAHSLGRSLLTRQVERPVLSRALARSLSPPLSFPPFLSLFLETDDRAARSPRLTGRTASCGITWDNYSDHPVARRVTERTAVITAIPRIRVRLFGDYVEGAEESSNETAP